MKMILWISLFFLSFVGMIAGLYFAKDKIHPPTQTQPHAGSPAHEGSAGPDSSYDSPVDSLSVVTDGLLSQLSERVNDVQERDATIAKLNAQVAMLKKENDSLKKQSANLADLKLLKLKQEERIAELAKTLGAIKADVLSPMLANLPDEVITIIYDKAQAKERTKIFNALPPERSGRILSQIAGGETGKKTN
ncbi:MAG TPA: hypothetical protein VGA99_13575 [bacterium]